VRKVTHARTIHISLASDSATAKDRSRERGEILRGGDALPVARF
jgi:hypothetical protein